MTKTPKSDIVLHQTLNQGLLIKIMNKLYSLKLEIQHKLAIFLVVLSILGSNIPQVVKAESSLDSHWAYGTSVEIGLPTAQDRQPRKIVTVLATAYSSTIDQTDDTPFETANGMHVYDGLVAANWLPFGTRVKFPDLYGDKIFTVNDRMNAKYTHTNVDIWMNAPRQVVNEFAAKRIKMEIY